MVDQYNLKRDQLKNTRLVFEKIYLINRHKAFNYTREHKVDRCNVSNGGEVIKCRGELEDVTIIQGSELLF